MQPRKDGLGAYVGDAPNQRALTFCARLAPEPWQPAPLSVRELRALVERLLALKDMQQQEANRLEAQGDSAVLRTSIEAHIGYCCTQCKARSPSGSSRSLRPLPSRMSTTQRPASTSPSSSRVASIRRMPVA